MVIAPCHGIVTEPCPHRCRSSWTWGSFVSRWNNRPRRRPSLPDVPGAAASLFHLVSRCWRHPPCSTSLCNSQRQTFQLHLLLFNFLITSDNILRWFCKHYRCRKGKRVWINTVKHKFYPCTLSKWMDANRPHRLRSLLFVGRHGADSPSWVEYKRQKLNVLARILSTLLISTLCLEEDTAFLHTSRKIKQFGWKFQTILLREYWFYKSENIAYLPINVLSWSQSNEDISKSVVGAFP